MTTMIKGPMGKLSLSRLAWTAFCLGGLGLTQLACSKDKEDEGKKPDAAKASHKPVGDRYADGKKLKDELKTWPKRWAEFEALPGCEPLLEAAPDRESCTKAASALADLKAASAAGKPDAELLRLAANLALTTEDALDKLRPALSAQQLAASKAAAEAKPVDTKPAATKGPQPKAAAPVPSASAKPTTAPSATAKALEAQPPRVEDPAAVVVRVYSRSSRAALRYVGLYLKFGPLSVRTAAFQELETISKDKAAWSTVARTLLEAARVENDKALQGKLKALAQRLSRRPPGAPGAVGVHPVLPPDAPNSRPVPPGHPAPSAPAPKAPAPAPAQ